MMADTAGAAAERSHLEPTGGGAHTGYGTSLWKSEVYPQGHTFSNKITLPNPPQIAINW